MTAVLDAPAPVDELTIEVSDPTGFQHVTLEGVRASATTSDIVAMASGALRLPQNVLWDIRDDHSSRLLPPDSPIGDVAGQEAPHLKVTMQPDAGLAGHPIC